MDEQPVNNGIAGDNLDQASSSSLLDEIKKEALQELVPLVDSLEGSPERKFEVIMNAVRVDFSEELLKKALNVAKAIDDPTEKANALIDIINETNFQAE